MAHLNEILHWFSGGHFHYMKGWECIGWDLTQGWIGIILRTLVIVGYLIIGAHWYKGLRAMKDGIGKSSLFAMVNIFVFCAICGYLFPIINMWYPAWRIENLFLSVLVFFTWKYAFNTPKLKVDYEEI